MLYSKRFQKYSCRYCPNEYTLDEVKNIPKPIQMPSKAVERVFNVDDVALFKRKEQPTPPPQAATVPPLATQLPPTPTEPTFPGPVTPAPVPASAAPVTPVATVVEPIIDHVMLGNNIGNSNDDDRELPPAFNFFETKEQEKPEKQYTIQDDPRLAIFRKVKSVVDFNPTPKELQSFSLIGTKFSLREGK